MSESCSPPEIETLKRPSSFDPTCENCSKKARNDNPGKMAVLKLEDRLNGILCCAVCLDLPNVAVFQCSNGHLMCAGCLSHLLADARLKDETATCPGCRCDIVKNACSRNLAVEKAISELPVECQFCSESLPRCEIQNHECQICEYRIVPCKYTRIGCTWQGPYNELNIHHQTCLHPNKTGEEILSTLNDMEENYNQEVKLYRSVFNLLSFEKIAFNDLQLKPCRSDDFITKLFYETTRFNTFNVQWMVKARINDNEKDPSKSYRRTISYQISLKTKTTSPMLVHYVCLKGPYSEAKVNSRIHEFEFSDDKSESEFHELPLFDYYECNKLLSSKLINFRLIMFLVQK